MSSIILFIPIIDKLFVDRHHKSDKNNIVAVLINSYLTNKKYVGNSAVFEHN